MPARGSHLFDSTESSSKRCLVAKAGQLCDLREPLISLRKQAFGAFDAELNEVLMNRSAQASAEAPGEMAFRQRTCSGQLCDGDIPFQLCAQHFLGPQLLPSLQPAPG